MATLPLNSKRHHRRAYFRSEFFQKLCHTLMLKILVLFGIGLEASQQFEARSPTLTVHRLKRRTEARTGSHRGTVARDPVAVL